MKLVGLIHFQFGLYVGGTEISERKYIIVCTWKKDVKTVSSVNTCMNSMTGGSIPTRVKRFYLSHVTTLRDRL